MSRRQLLGGGAAALAGLAVGAGARATGDAKAAAPAAPPKRVERADQTRVASADRDRGDRAYRLRVEAARQERDLPAPEHPTNGDEAALPRWISCYSKGLPHDALGEVDDASYRLLVAAVRSGDPRDFERIPLGGQTKLANPQGALAYSLVGPDSSRVGLVPPPRFASPEQGSELVELYWQALARDVSFTAYDDHPLIARAAQDLSRLSDFKGPRDGGAVTPATLFRGFGPGPLRGPYVSQLLLRDIPLTPVFAEQRLRTAVPGLDYRTEWDDWLAGSPRSSPEPRSSRPPSSSTSSTTATTGAPAGAASRLTA